MKAKILLTLSLCLVSVAATFAQDQTVSPDQNSTPPPSKHMLREDSAAINALVLYPDTVRLDIFEASEFPASIVSIASLQKNTSSGFNDIVSSYSKEDQEDFWNLSRYPDLVGSLTAGGSKSPSDVNNILANFPDDIHDAALRQASAHPDVLAKMNDLQNNTNAQFEQILMDYPPTTQNALRDLVHYPEIISLMNDHLSLTVRVGDHYRRNPGGVVNWADSLNQVEVQQNAQSAAEWKQNLQQDTAAASDLQSAANDYAQQNGYTEAEINTPPDPDYVTNYTCAPYSYWFGYPTWYPYSYWYPYPYWFDCGFYYNRFGQMVVIGAPSFYFTNWYFYYPEHWHNYPHLASSYVNHYYGPRRLATSNSVIVHNWVRDNRSYLPKDFVTNRSARVDAIRQVGQLHMDARAQNGGKPMTAAARDEYFKNNATKYSSLSHSTDNRLGNNVREENTTHILQEPIKQPASHISQSVQQPVRQQQQPVRQTQAQPSFNNINRAQDYHRAVWQQAQPVARPQSESAPRMAPSRSFSGGGGGGRSGGGGGRR